MATPLTDAINALTAYANETTGANDATLSDAVESLVAGYGGGGGWSTDGVASGTEPSGEITITGNSIRMYCFYQCSNLTKVTMPNVTEIPSFAFSDCTKLKEVVMPSVTYINQRAFQKTALEQFETNSVIDFNAYVFNGCSNLVRVSMPNTPTNAKSNSIFFKCVNMTYCDFGNISAIQNSCFYYCKKLSTLILRNSSAVVTLKSINALQDSSMRKGGSGCTIYVPQALVEDYKVANNWHTYYSYGTITFMPIEGSEYEI